MARREQQLLDILEPTVEAMGYELVHVELVRAKTVILRLYIDKPDGVGLDDCSAVSNQVSGVLDVEDPIQSEYNLEVSSPGWDRPLGKLEHYQRFVGERAAIQLSMAMQGRRKFTGEIAAVNGRQIDLVVDGETVSIDFDQIEKGRLAPA